MSAFWYNDRFKICFFGIPKNASTTIRIVFDMNNNIEYTSETSIKKEGYINFTVIRNPFTRIISSYNEVLKLRVDTGEAVSITKSLPFYKISDPQRRFEQFIDDIKNNLYDIHLKPQSLFIEDADIDVYLRFEHLKMDLKNKLNINLPHLSNLNSSSKNKLILTGSVKKKIKEMYKEDFELYKKIN
jgi:hypothetical protein